MDGGGVPGSLYRVPLEKCNVNPAVGSLHGFDLRRVLALTDRKALPDVVVLGVQPARIAWSVELSSEVQGALPRLLAAVRQEVGSDLTLKHSPLPQL